MSSNNWINGQPFTVTAAQVATFKAVKKTFQCNLCGRVLTEGMVARWICTAGIKSPALPNFFVCHACDGIDVISRAQNSYLQATRLAKQWGIYGPDWQHR